MWSRTGTAAELCFLTELTSLTLVLLWPDVNLLSSARARPARLGLQGTPEGTAWWSWEAGVPLGRGSPVLNILLAGRGQQPGAPGFRAWPPRVHFLDWTSHSASQISLLHLGGGGGSDSCLQGALGPGMAWQPQPPLPSTCQAQLTLLQFPQLPPPPGSQSASPADPPPGPLLAAGTQVGSSISI